MKEKEMFDSFRFDELFFANRNTPKKKVFYLKAKVFCGKLKTTVGVKKNIFAYFLVG